MRPIPVTPTGERGQSLTPAELQQQYDQCTALLASLRAARPIPEQRRRNRIDFLLTWQSRLSAAKDAYLAKENLTEAQWRCQAEADAPGVAIPRP